MTEQDTFVQIRQVDGKPLAVLRQQYYRSDGTNEMLFDEKSLRLRLANLKKDGYAHDQTAAALRALAKARGES